EQALRGLDDRRHDAGLRDDAAHGADGASPDAQGDLAYLQLELRRAGERVTAPVHRRRARVRRLTSERHLVPPDPDRAQHDAERQVERLEHRALLDVPLEIRGCTLEL